MKIPLMNLVFQLLKVLTFHHTLTEEFVKIMETPSENCGHAMQLTQA